MAKITNHVARVGKPVPEGCLVRNPLDAWLNRIRCYRPGKEFGVRVSRATGSYRLITRGRSCDGGSAASTADSMDRSEI